MKNNLPKEGWYVKNTHSINVEPVVEFIGRETLRNLLPKLSAGASTQKPFGIFGAVANLLFLTSPLITISLFTFA